MEITVEHIKTILKKLLDNSDKIDFISVLSYTGILDIENYRTYRISYTVNNVVFNINPWCENTIGIGKDRRTDITVTCSDEDFLEIVLLTHKLNKVYQDKICNEFMHSLD